MRRARSALLLLSLLAALPAAGCVDAVGDNGRGPATVDNGYLRCYGPTQEHAIASWQGPEGAEALPSAAVATPVDVAQGTLALRIEVAQPTVAGWWRVALLDPDGVEVWENHRAAESVNLGGGTVSRAMPGAYTLSWTSDGAIATAARVDIRAEVCTDYEIRA